MIVLRSCVALSAFDLATRCPVLTPHTVLPGLEWRRRGVHGLPGKRVARLPVLNCVPAVQ